MKSLSLIAASLLAVAACGDDDHNHDDHDHDATDGGMAGDVSLAFVGTPTMATEAGSTVDYTWTVANNTEEDLHVTAIRYCEGADVVDCGMGEQGTYTAVPGVEDGDNYTASVMFDTEGTVTVVAYAHVGEFPYSSESFNLVVGPASDI